MRTMRARKANLMRAISFLSFILIFAFISRGQTGFTGTLLGTDGQPMAKSEVHLTKLGQWTPIDSVEIAGDGTYRISTNLTGPFLLQYSGTDHLPGNVLVATGKPVTEAIMVRLTTKRHAQPEVVFANPSSSMARAAAVYTKWMRQREAAPEALEQHINAGKPGEFTYDFSPELKRLARQYAKEKDPLLKQILLLIQVDLSGLNHPRDSDLYVKYLAAAMEHVSPASPYWSLNLGAVDMIGAIAEGYGPSTQKSLKPSACRQFADDFLKRNSDAEGKAMIWFGRLVSAKDRGDEQAVAKYHDLLSTDFAKTRMAKFAARFLASSHNIVVGKTIPKFSLASLTDPKMTYTNESFRGKIFLMDFWSTWCTPCLEELKDLHKAYERFKSKNFEILSLSADLKPEIVINFRRGKWNMPWQHVFLDPRTAPLVKREFEVLGAHRLILVDGNTGTILATDGDCRMEKLEKTLTKFVGEVR